MTFSQLIHTLESLNKRLREQSMKAVNTTLTLRNWFFGFYIVEFEQNGKDKAEYGKSLLKNISKAIESLKIPNTNERELRRYRQFYLTYPAIIQNFKQDDLIRGMLHPELREISNLSIRELKTPEFQIDDNHFLNLLSRISYSHFVELIRVDDALKRYFYELECLKGTWSVKELKRQIGSLLYERTGLSSDKSKLLKTTQDTSIQAKPQDFIRDPYVFEFLGLKPKEIFQERDLENALLEHLLQFLLELGKGFCFEAQQKRIVIDNEHYFIDLVFYHRLLHCNVLIDIKTERFKYTHAGQMNMYLEYYKKYEMMPGDNPPVGILLCTEKDNEQVAFATAGIDDKVFISKYLVALPDKKELEQFIKKELNA